MDIIKDKSFQRGLISGLTLAGLFYALKSQLIGKNQTNQIQPRTQDFQQNNEMEGEELMKEQLVRNYQFFGDASQKKIENSHVMIFGIGGVGSHVLSCLARSGIGEITIIDFDQVSLSSLNRHAFATRDHVGRSKVEVFVTFLKRIVPKLKLKVFESYVTPENIHSYFDKQKKPHFVIDCIDNLDAKTALVAYCVQNEIKIISSCGAGMKSDPTRIQIRDISQSSYDDLARALRIRLKKYNIREGVTVVFSNEISEKELLPLKEHQINKVGDYQTFKNYRVRIIPVMGAMPALIAYSISSYILCQLAEQSFMYLNQRLRPQQKDDVKQTTYNRLYQIVLTLGKKMGIRADDINIDIEDMYIIARETYDWKCLICGKLFSKIIDKRSLALELVKWDPEGEISLKNLVPMYGECIKMHTQITKSSDLVIQYGQMMINKKQEKDDIIDQIVRTKKVLFN